MASRNDLPFLHFGIFFNGELDKLVYNFMSRTWDLLQH